MAQTYTNTSTRTYTRARLHLLRVQFKSFATRFEFTEKCIEWLPIAVDRHLVSALIVNANTSAGETAASIKLRIDWDAHEQLKETTQVSIDTRWNGEVAPQLEVFEESFEEFVREQNLVLDRRIHLSEACRGDPALHRETLEKLDLIPGAALRWKNKPVGHTDRISALGELSTQVEFADDEE